MNKNSQKNTQYACDYLLNRTYLETWRRGEKYFEEGRVQIIIMDEKSITGLVKGSQLYEVGLAFRGGGISRRCSCPVSDFCKHIVAVAIAWDEARGLGRPDAVTVEDETIPPPLISRAQIDQMYRDPLNVDLEAMRLASSESGSWSRPHARLPNSPSFNTDQSSPLSIDEASRAFREITQWARKSSYDPYFCAGEMVAAFCEVMRSISQRLSSSLPTVSARILRESQKFHYELIMQLIDDSDGLHNFTEAHLENLYQNIGKIRVGTKEQGKYQKWLKEFENHRNDY